jgi:hypothetical protein
MSTQSVYLGDMSTGGLTLADRVAELREWITTGYARDLRVAAGLSQALAAQDCEVTASTVHRYCSLGGEDCNPPQILPLTSSVLGARNGVDGGHGWWHDGDPA